MSSSERLESREDDVPLPPPESDWVRNENNEAAWSNYAGEPGGGEQAGAVLEGRPLVTPETFPEFDPAFSSDQGSDSTQTDIEATEVWTRGEGAAERVTELHDEPNPPTMQLGEMALDGAVEPEAAPEIPEAEVIDGVVETDRSAVTENEARDNVQAALQEPADRRLDTVEPSGFRERVAESEAQDVVSLGEAEDYARDDLGIEQVDYSDFDQQTANEVNATLEVLRDKYPEVGGIEYLGSIQSRNQAIEERRPDLAAESRAEIREPADGVVAVALRNTGEFNGISINRAWSGDYVSSSIGSQLSEFQGESSQGSGSMSGVVAHEFGHLVEYHLQESGQLDEVNDRLSEIKANGRHYVRDEVSTYANKSDAELFAELFAEYQLSDSPREPARILGTTVDKILDR
jgi:hypothetical protein